MKLFIALSLIASPVFWQVTTAAVAVAQEPAKASSSYIRSLNPSEQRIIRVTMESDRYLFELCMVSQEQRCIPLGLRTTGYTMSEILSHRSHLKFKGLWRGILDVGVVGASVVGGAAVGAVIGNIGSSPGRPGGGIPIALGLVGGAVIGGAGGFMSLFIVDSLNPLQPLSLAGTISEKDLLTLKVSSVIIDSSVSDFATELYKFLSGIE